MPPVLARSASDGGHGPRTMAPLGRTQAPQTGHPNNEGRVVVLESKVNKRAAGTRAQRAAPRPYLVIYPTTPAQRESGTENSGKVTLALLGRYSEIRQSESVAASRVSLTFGYGLIESNQSSNCFKNGPSAATARRADYRRPNIYYRDSRRVTINQGHAMDAAKDALLSVKETAQRLSICRRTLEREVARKKFPPPVKIAGKSLYFLSDVVGYLSALKAERDGRYSRA